MDSESVSVVLLDIEGTTSSIQYVYDRLFPYVRLELPRFLVTHWNDDATRAACDTLAHESGAVRGFSLDETLIEAFRLMDNDVKSTGLKELQGLVSAEGYASGKLRSHFYDDVPPALDRWTANGIACCVYSSGSIGAQKNFYRYAEAGDLSHFIAANFDTTTGPKRESASYAAIASALKTPAEHALFLSDVVQELDAAKSAGMQTVLIIRPGNKPVADGHGHRTARSFDEL